MGDFDDFWNGDRAECMHKEYWLQNRVQEKQWGPFPTDDAAWKHLFGRDSDEDERKEYAICGWSVGYTYKRPNA